MGVRDDNDRVTRMIGALSDITVRKQTEIELREARDEAEAATFAKSRFLANMSHELRTPLNAIIGIAEMLLEDADDKGLAEFAEPLERVCRAGRHLLYLINELLDLSKIEAGKIELFIEEFDIAALIDEAVAIAEPLAEQNANSLNTDYSPALGSMRADRTRVHQVVLNLLSNACKFSKSAPVGVTASRQPSVDGDWLEVRVTDAGSASPTISWSRCSMNSPRPTARHRDATAAPAWGLRSVAVSVA